MTAFSKTSTTVPFAKTPTLALLSMLIPFLTTAPSFKITLYSSGSATSRPPFLPLPFLSMVFKEAPPPLAASISLSLKLPLRSSISFSSSTSPASSSFVKVVLNMCKKKLFSSLNIFKNAGELSKTAESPRRAKYFTLSFSSPLTIRYFRQSKY